MIDLNAFGLRSYNTYAIEEDSLLELISKAIQMVNQGEIDIKDMQEAIKYLLGEGLNLEVVKKLELMIEDGTMEELINKTVFEGLNEKLNAAITEVESLRQEFTDLNDNIENTLILFRDEINKIIEDFKTQLEKEMGSFSKSLDFAPLLNEPNLKLFCTTNSKDFWGRKQPLTLCALVENGSKVLSIKESIIPNRSYCWDADMLFFNGYYHIAFDYKEGFEDDFVDTRRGLVDIYRTKDFVNYERLIISTEFKNTFAPSLVESEGKLYCFMSLSHATTSYKDKYGNDMFETGVGFVEIFDNFKGYSGVTWKSEFGNRTLDPQVYNINGKYYAYIKDEANKNTDIYSSNSLFSRFNFEKKIDIGQDVEGASLCRVGDLYHLYLDIYWNNKGYCYLVGESPTSFYGDVLYLNEPFQPNHKVGHFGACDVETKEQKEILNNFLLTYNIDPYAKSSGVETMFDKPRTTVDLEVIAKGNGEIITNSSGYKSIQIYDVKLCGGCIYTISGSKGVNIQRVDTSYLRQGESIYFLLATGDTTSFLSVESRGFYIPSLTDEGGVKKITFRVSDGYLDQLIKATKVGDSMLFESVINHDLRRQMKNNGVN